jgi:tRNA-specific 2-thiouridylase
LDGGERRFVTRVDTGSNTVTVGPRGSLTAESLLAYEVVWRGGVGEVAVTCRLRYRGPEASAVAVLRGGVLRVRFDAPVEAPAPGQAIVCYDGDTVLGGGVIGETS